MATIVKYIGSGGSTALELDDSGNLTIAGALTGSVTGAVTGDVAGAVTLTAYTVATLPAVVAGKIIYVSDGAAGNPCLAVGDGTNYLRCDTLAAVSAS